MLAVRCLGGEPATAAATVNAGVVTTITVTSGGSGYTAEPLVLISGGGGSGATAKAILSGDKVATVVVLTAGSGYSSAPLVTLAAPTFLLELTMKLGPRLKIEGPAGIAARLEWSEDISGPWTPWINVVVSEGGVLVDTSAGSYRQFYRAVSASQPKSPTGFVWIEPGTFAMGSPADEQWRLSDEVQHIVTLTQGFWLSDHEVTESEYQAVIGSNLPSFKGDLNQPVETVSWDDAVLYCQKLTDRERAVGRITAHQAYRLPIESEWEYAARAGTRGSRYAELDAIAWWNGNHGGQTHPVKQKAANAWGLYDMIGNVAEWCSDRYGEYPTGPSSGYRRVIRSSSCYDGSRYSRSAFRTKREPGFRSTIGLGFRPALSEVR